MKKQQQHQVIDDFAKNDEIFAQVIKENEDRKKERREKLWKEGKRSNQ